MTRLPVLACVDNISQSFGFRSALFGTLYSREEESVQLPIGCRSK